MADDLTDEFHQAMLDIYREADKLGYRPTYFLRMVHEYGGVETARRLIQKPTDGFNTLWELGRLDLSVEAHVVQERWTPLFSDAERCQAWGRLKDVGYDPSANA